MNTLKTILKNLRILPKSFYLDEFVYNTRKELKEECNYIMESNKQMLYREMILKYSNSSLFSIPQVLGIFYEFTKLIRWF